MIYKINKNNRKCILKINKFNIAHNVGGFKKYAIAFCQHGERQ